MNNLKKLWSFMRPYRIPIFGATFFIVLSVVLSTIMPLLEGQITTQLLSDVQAMDKQVAGAHIQFDVILQILSTLLVIYVVSTVARISYQFLLANSIQSAIFDIRQAVKDKMTRLPIRYFDAHTAGDLMSRMSTDVEVLSAALQQGVAQILTAILMLVLAVIMMFALDVRMAWIGVAIIPLSLIVSRIVVGRSQGLFTKQQASLAHLQSVVQERYTGFNEIKLFNYQEQAQADFAIANETLCETGFKANFISGLMSPSVSALTYFAIALSVQIGMANVLTGALTVGALQAFIRYIWQVNQPLSQMTQLSSTLQSSFAAMDRIFTYLDEEEEAKDPVHPQTFTDFKGAIRFEDVVFGYGETPIIRGLSVDIQPGELVAIVGPTGAGKTTIINLLMRFYDVDSGAIKIDDIDIRDVRRDDLRALFGMVLQDTWLFSGKIADNIAYGRDGATLEQIEAAAKRANVHHFITTLPDGYDMVLNEESSNISNGEKQLLTIARVMLNDPKILILDEATSSVDTRLDAMIQEAMATLTKGRTSFVIAHRLSTIRNADKILVVRDGNVIEQGNHDDLMIANGFYADLYNSQFADYDQS